MHNNDGIDGCPYLIHPACAAYPMMSDESYARLVESIREVGGLEYPVLLSADGLTLLDGRNRLAACRQLGIEPTTQLAEAELDDEAIVAKIVARNVEHREMDTLAKCQTAERFLPIYQALAKANQMSHGGTAPGRNTSVASDGSVQRGEATELAARAAGIGRSTFKEYLMVKKGDDVMLSAKMQTGKISPKAAAKIVRKQWEETAPVDSTSSEMPQEVASTSKPSTGQGARIAASLRRVVASIEAMESPAPEDIGLIQGATKELNAAIGKWMLGMMDDPEATAVMRRTAGIETPVSMALLCAAPTPRRKA